MRKLVYLVAAALAVPAAAAPPPKLLLAISVDHLSADLFDEYRPHFTGGFARLSRGTVFRNGYQAHATTETCPGQATILTGTHPATNGIVGNDWYDLTLSRSDKRVYCAEDARVPGSSSRDYTLSAAHLKVPTLGDLLKRRSPASFNVAVGGKDRSAVMMGGKAVDQLWYRVGRQFGTNLENAPVPHSVGQANAAVAAAISTAREPLVPPLLCASKAQEIAVGDDGRRVGSGRFGRAAGDGAAFLASPEFDAAVLALSAALIRELGLGQDESPDIVSIALAGTDYVGHTYGPGGQEMCLQLLSLDRDLGDFFDFLDRGGIDYAVMLTADHGGPDLPERARTQGIAGAARIDPALDTDAVARTIGEKLGLDRPGAGRRWQRLH